MRISHKRFFTTISLFTFLAMMPMGCNLFCANTCGCGPISKPNVLVIQSFATKTVTHSGKEIPDSATRHFNEVFKTLQIDKVEYKTQSLINPSASWSFGAAFACSPIPPETENTLYLIQIINQKEFTLIDGTTFSVGDNITSLFGMNHFHATGLSPITDFIAPGRKLTLDDYFKIGFLENPEKELYLEFTIRLVFDDAQEFLLTDQILNVR